MKKCQFFHKIERLDVGLEIAGFMRSSETFDSVNRTPGLPLCTASENALFRTQELHSVHFF